MKHGVCFFSVLLFLLLEGCVGEERALYFTDEEIDVGLLDRNKLSDTILFRYRNISSAPEIIKNVLSTDLSVLPSWNREPLLPGKSQVLKVAVTPGKWNGPFAVRLTVYTGENKKPYSLKFKGMVEKIEEDIFKYDLGEGLKMSAPFVRLGQVFAGETATDTLWVYNGTSDLKELKFRYDVKILRVKADKNYLRAGDSARIAVTFAPVDKEKYGNFNESIYWLASKDNASRPICILASARVVENFLKMTEEEREIAPCLVLEESEYDFGDVEEGKIVSRKFRVDNKGKSNLILRNVEASCGCTVADIEKRVIKPGESGYLSVAFDTGGREGKQAKTVQVTCNDYRASSFVLHVRANVLKINK